MRVETRYSRHLLLREIGEKGQEKIRQAKVLVIGAGGLGSPALLYLAAAGTGTLGIMDDDTVSESNLQRQILYDSRCIGRPKVEIARRKLQDLNPDCSVLPMQLRLTPENAREIIGQYDVVVDATDNLTSRYLIDDTCRQTGKPFVYGGVCEFKGQVSVFNYQGGPSYRDLYEYDGEESRLRESKGVIGALPGIVGSLQAAETVKILTGSSHTLSGKLLLIDLLENSFRIIDLKV